MTGLVTSDARRPARVILLTLFSLRGVGSSGKHQARSGWAVGYPETGPLSPDRLLDPLDAGA